MKMTLKILKRIKLIKIFKRKSESGKKISLMFFLTLATSTSSVSMDLCQDSSNGFTKLTLAWQFLNIQLSECFICESKIKTRTIAQLISARRIRSDLTLARAKRGAISTCLSWLNTSTTIDERMWSI